MYQQAANPSFQMQSTSTTKTDQPVLNTSKSPSDTDEQNGVVIPAVAPLPLVAHPAATFRGKRPVRLAFGTSGLRGLVNDMTDLEIFSNTTVFLHYLEEGGD